MQQIMLSIVVAGALAGGAAAGQSGEAVRDERVLATVRIPAGVLANGKPLAAGSYEVRLTDRRPTPLVGQSADSARGVEFVINGRVAGEDVAIVLRDDDLPAEGASSQRVRDGIRVDVPKAASSCGFQ